MRSSNIDHEILCICNWTRKYLVENNIYNNKRFSQPRKINLILILSNQVFEQMHIISDYLPFIFNKKYFDEMKAINDREFKDYTPPEALSMAVNFGRQIFDVPVKNLIDYNLKTDSYNENAIKDVLSQLSPSKVRIYHLSPDEETDIDLKYADGAFRVEEISQQEINSWGDSEIAILLPEPEIISLDDSEDKIVVSKEFETPQRHP